MKNGRITFASRYSVSMWLLVLCLSFLGCSNGSSSSNTQTNTSSNTPSEITYPATFTLDANALGYYEKINNIANLTVVSKDPNHLRAEYRAGFVQGHLQKPVLPAARDNHWRALFRGSINRTVLSQTNDVLKTNYASFINYIRTTQDVKAAQGLRRLLFRMVGIYHGAVLDQPSSLDFSGNWLPDNAYFKTSEMSMDFETSQITFMDLYWINSYFDTLDALTNSAIIVRPSDRPWSCSAFLKRMNGDVVLAHNLWGSYLSQSMAMNVSVNGDIITFNAQTPGLIGSLTDFGYNNKGILFNETTHSYTSVQSKINAVWIFWRAALAEHYSASIDDFLHYISIDNSGTYLNGFMLVDAKTNETGLIDMSHNMFVLFRSNGGPYTIKTIPEGLPTDYDADMLTPDYIMGINYPVSLQVRRDLQSYDSPTRRAQFKAMLPGVTDLDGCKTLITYFDPAFPDSIFSRLDLITPSHPRSSCFGAIDAKIATASMVRDTMKLTGDLDMTSSAKGFWMLFGTARANGQPFIWSRSAWSSWKHPNVPDVLDGTFTQLDLHLK